MDLLNSQAEEVSFTKHCCTYFAPNPSLLVYYITLSCWRLLDRVFWRWNRVFCWWLGICRRLGIYWWSSKQQGQSYKGSDWLLKGSQAKSSPLDTVGYFHLTRGSLLFPLCGLHRSLLTGACFELNDLKSRVIILKVVFKKQKYKCRQASKQRSQRGFVQDCAQRSLQSSSYT